MKASERRRVLLLCAALACCCAACASPRDIYYAATHQRVRVPTANMEPTIKPGDEAAVDVGYYEGHAVERFDLVTFRLSLENIPADTGGTIDEETVFLKRVVGLGGETLEVKRGRVYIDGRVQDEPFATVPLDKKEQFGPVKIPEGEYFLMGDNRQNSLDGRFWPRPTLRKQNILGKVVEIFSR
jgi:signal peptidase I